MAIIIKSQSRKEPSFKNLFHYMTRDEDDFKKFIFHNVFGQNEEKIIAQFEKNSAFLPTRKGGNYLYHEILALPENDRVSQKQQELFLGDIARKYLMERAPYQLAIGVVHFDKKNIHLHLMISANNYRSEKRASLTKNKFLQVQRNIEEYQITHYPSLGQDMIYARDAIALNKAIKIKERAFQFNKRTAQKPERYEVQNKVEMVLLAASSLKDLKRLLEREGLKIYQSRGAYGVINLKTGRKHRFKTLLLEKAFQETLTQIKRIEANKKEIKQIRNLQFEKKQREQEQGHDNPWEDERHS